MSELASLDFLLTISPSKHTYTLLTHFGRLQLPLPVCSVYRVSSAQFFFPLSLSRLGVVNKQNVNSQL